MEIHSAFLLDFSDKKFFSNRDEIKLSVRKGISQDNTSAVKTFR